MATRAEIRALVRAKLGDGSAAAPLWSDADLNHFGTIALYTYGRWEPQTAVASSVVTAGATTVPYPAVIPDGWVTKVLDGVGAVVSPNDAAGLQQPAMHVYQAQGWRSWQRTLYLVRPVASAEAGTWGIEYLASRTMPSDDVTAVPIEFGHEPVVVQLMVAEALHQRANDDYKRGAKADFGPVDEARQRARDLWALGKRRARGSSFDVV